MFEVLDPMVRNRDVIPSAEIIARLTAAEDSEWREYGRGREPISQRGLAMLLEQFDIGPPGVIHPSRRSDDSRRGYRCDQIRAVREVRSGLPDRQHGALGHGPDGLYGLQGERRPGARAAAHQGRLADLYPTQEPEPEARHVDHPGTPGVGADHRGDSRAAYDVPRQRIWAAVQVRGKPGDVDEEARCEAGLPNVSSHGLRKACARRLAEAGCTPHQIGAITGHTTLKQIENYTKAADQKRLAVEAMRGIR
jgi:Protein of unknown function (DUF3631)/Phage integrase family